LKTSGRAEHGAKREPGEPSDHKPKSANGLASRRDAEAQRTGVFDCRNAWSSFGIWWVKSLLKYSGMSRATDLEGRARREEGAGRAQ